jgi:hypothetical protein
VLDRDGYIRHSNVPLSEGAANPAKFIGAAQIPWEETRGPWPVSGAEITANGYVGPNLMLKVFDDRRACVLQLSTTQAQQKFANKPDRSSTESQICKIER